MSFKNILVVETHHSGHHISYLRELLFAAAPSCNRLLLLATQSVLNNLNEQTNPLAECVEVHCLRGLPCYKNLRNKTLSWAFFNLRRLAMYSRWVNRLKLSESGTLIVFPTIYDNEFVGMSWSRSVFPFKYVGIYMNSHFFRQRLDLYHRDCVLREPLFLKDRRTAGIALLDPRIIEPAKVYAPQAAFTVVPDFVRTVFAAPGTKWERLVEIAKGRPIVGVFGYLKRSKGILRFREAARLIGSAAVFVAVGELPAGDYSREELSDLRAGSLDAESSFHLLEGRIATDQEFQGMFRGCSVICCAYEDFLSSSNQVSLAAVHGKYVVVPPQGCMTEVAKSLSNGVPVIDESIKSLCMALQVAIDRTKNAPLTSQQIQYARAALSELAFRNAFSELLSAF